MSKQSYFRLIQLVFPPLVTEDSLFNLLTVSHAYPKQIRNDPNRSTYFQNSAAEPY